MLISDDSLMEGFVDCIIDAYYEVIVPYWEKIETILKLNPTYSKAFMETKLPRTELERISRRVSIVGHVV